MHLSLARSESIGRQVRAGGTTSAVVQAYGDYSAAPAGSYGLNADELLRVDCAQLRPLGRVRR